MIRFDREPTVTEADLPKPLEFRRFHPFLKGVFSQWHPTPFAVDGTSYTCTEQYMMAAKASLFGDTTKFAQIMASDDPALQKRLGANVAPFDEATWHRWRCTIVYDANRAKFKRNPGATRQLLRTAPAMLVEANPRDWNWGNGLAMDDPRNHDPNAWKGANLLGRILTKLRDELPATQT
ncbi:MAG: NADAR family protein [Pseudomonadota bacterium]